MERLMERAGAIRSKGTPMTLLGPELKVGDKAPDFRVVDAGLHPVTLRDTTGAVRLFSVVPSLDTGVCAIQTKTFNARAHQIAEDVKVYTLSMDLPFAQNRFVEHNHIDRIRTLSDYQDRSFGINWGLLTKENKLLARAVFIVDKNDVIRYIQIVPDTSNEPDYDDALQALKRVTQQPTARV